MKYPLSNEDRIGSSTIRFTLLESAGTAGADQEATSSEQPSSSEPTIEMYIPNGLQLSDNVNYTDANLGVLGQIAYEAAGGNGMTGSISRGLGAVRGQGESFGAALRDPEVRSLLTVLAGGALAGTTIASILERVGGNTATAVGAGAGALLGAGAIAGAAQLGAGRTLNPNTKALFQSVGIRSFQLQFNMIPTSSDEAEVIADIVKFFRKNLYPSTLSTGGYQIFLKYPKKFNIQIVPSDATSSKHVVNFKPCFLTNVSRTYNPTSTTYHLDGAPVETVLSLSFKEHETLTSEDIDGGM